MPMKRTALITYLPKQRDIDNINESIFEATLAFSIPTFVAHVFNVRVDRKIENVSPSTTKRAR